MMEKAITSNICTCLILKKVKILGLKRLRMDLLSVELMRAGNIFP